MTDNKRAGPAGKSVDQKTAERSLVKITRRRFTKAGAVAPLVLTLGSRPVWGQTCSFSGQLSGNDYSTTAPIGVGQQPSYWIGQPDTSWPGGASRNAKISLFVNDTCNVFGDKTFGALLELGDKNLGAEAAAAVLNILHGKYGYEMHGLIDFLCTAGAHPGAVDVLICLNSR